MMIYWQLFLSFLKVGLFGFGGGYAIVALIQYELVEKHAWISMGDFTNIVAISQMTPGPLAINSATYVGYAATSSVWGSVVATTAVVLPSLVLMTIICVFLVKFRNNKYVEYAFWGLRPTVVGLIAAAALVLANSSNFIDIYSFIIFAVVCITTIKKANPIIMLILSGIAGYFIY